MSAEERLQEIEAGIAAACSRSGISRDEVQLVAVSKTKPVEMIRDFYELGVRDFGENRPQELRDKAPVLPDDICWHMIGHLQQNKVKYVVGRAGLIHSIDSVRIAEAVSAEAVRKDVVCRILLEVNIAEEESKFGVTAADAAAFAKEVAGLPNLQVCGLMTIAPFVENPEKNRPVFAALKQLSVDIERQNIDNITMSVLSMGMTNDYIVAIEEGATIVRIGTALFGERS